MKILHLLSSNSYSGAENVVSQIFQMFDSEENIEMTYCSPNGSIKAFLEDRKMNYLLIEDFSLKSINIAINYYKPDIIHAHDVKASIKAAMLIGMKCKIISHMHVNHENMRRFNFKTIAYLISASFYNHIYWVSESSYINYLFRKFVKSKSSILFNVMVKDAILERMHKDSNVYNYDVVYVGRLTYQKNPHLLIKVLSAVCKEKNDIRCAIIGDGDLYEEAKRVSDEYGLSLNVDFLGFISNPLKYINSSKVLLITSRYEGTPMVALEAMALGCPIVTTPTDGLKDLVINGKTGFLCNDEESLANKVVQITDDENLFKKLSIESQYRFDELMDVEGYKHDLLVCYTKLYQHNL